MGKMGIMGMDGYYEIIFPESPKSPESPKYPESPESPKSSEPPEQA